MEPMLQKLKKQQEKEEEEAQQRKEGTEHASKKKAWSRVAVVHAISCKLSHKATSLVFHCKATISH